MKTPLKVFFIIFILLTGYACLCAFALRAIASDLKTISGIRSAQTIAAAFPAAKRINRNLKIAYPISPLLKINPQFKKAIESASTLTQTESLYEEFFATQKEKKILLVMQNQTELRPSGGFWGAYGTLLVKNSTVKEFETDDTFELDKKLIGKYTAPDPIKDIVSGEWRFWNANWSPDFKISAQQGLYFLDQLDTENKYDDIIAPNLNFVTSLLKISGPIKLDGYSFDISEDNFIEKMVYEPNSTATYSGQNSSDVISAQEKNRALAEIGKKALDQIVSQGKQADLAETIFDALKNQDIILFSRDERVQNAIEKIGWGGRIKTDQNFIMVVDANFGSKLDLLVDKKLTIKKLGINKFEADIDYQSLEQDIKKENQIFGNYRDLVRIYLPKSAQITSQSGGNDYHQLAEDNDLNASYLSNLVILEPGQSERIHLEWTVSDNLGKLSAIKQAGSNMQIYTEL